MSEPRRSAARTWLISGGLSALAFGLLGFTIWKNREDLARVLRGPFDGHFFGLMALGFGVYMVALMLTFLRWFILVRAQGTPFRFRDAVWLGFIGNLFNLVIPGAVGGDLVKLGFLFKMGMNKTQAAASLVIDRVLGLLGLFLLASLSGARAWPAAGPEPRRLILLIWAALAAGLVGLAVLFTPALYAPLKRLVAGRGKLAAVADELESMAAAYRSRLGTVLGVLAMAVGIHSLYIVAFYASGLALFRDYQIPPLADHFLIVPVVLFTTAAPLPFGALGVSEVASKQLFNLVHHPKGDLAMMGYRVLMYAGGVVCALVYLVKLGQVRSLAGPAAPADEELVPAPVAIDG